MSIDSYELIVQKMTAFLKNELREQECLCVVDYSIRRVGGFIDGWIETVITFTLGTIAGGMLSEIGKETWDSIKKFCSGLIKKQKSYKNQYRTEIKFIVSNKSIKVWYVVKIYNDNTEIDVLKVLQTFCKAIQSTNLDQSAFAGQTTSDETRLLIKTLHIGPNESDWFWETCNEVEDAK
jgi:hypothetical protein